MATSRRVSAVGGGVNVNHPAHWVFQNQQVFGEVKRGLGPIGNWFLCDNGVMKTVKLDARIRRASAGGAAADWIPGRCQGRDDLCPTGAAFAQQGRILLLQVLPVIGNFVDATTTRLHSARDLAT